MRLYLKVFREEAITISKILFCVGSSSLGNSWTSQWFPYHTGKIKIYINFFSIQSVINWYENLKSINKKEAYEKVCFVGLGMCKALAWTSQIGLGFDSQSHQYYC